MSNDFRTVPRYFLTSGLPAMIDELEVSVVDLSIKGARLQVTEPILAPVRRLVPPIGGFDVAFLLVFIAVSMVLSVVSRSF